MPKDSLVGLTLASDTSFHLASGPKHHLPLGRAITQRGGSLGWCQAPLAAWSLHLAADTSFHLASGPKHQCRLVATRGGSLGLASIGANGPKHQCRLVATPGRRH